MTDSFEKQDNLQEAQTGWQEPPIELIDAEALSMCSLKRQPFIINELLSPGLAVLAGAPKLGKSWLVLSMCQHIAEGKPLWGIETAGGSVLYIALEDSKARLQDRLLTITDEPSPKLKLATACGGLGEGLEDAVTYFVDAHPDAKLVVIDTFQMIRMQGREMSYSNDYSETSALKKLADRLHICILLVHHTRKLGDSDTLNEISGTTGIAGCADTLMVLKKPRRTDNKAVLYCTGRDISDRELTLELDRETCTWKHVSGDLPKKRALPPEINIIQAFMKKITRFDGSNSEFAEQYRGYSKSDLSPAVLKRLMNRYRQELEDRGVTFISLKTHKGRILSVVYSEVYDLTLNPSGEQDAEKLPQPVEEAEKPTSPEIAKPERQLTLSEVDSADDRETGEDTVMDEYDRYKDYYAEYDSCAADFDNYDGYIPDK